MALQPLDFSPSQMALSSPDYGKAIAQGLNNYMLQMKAKYARPAAEQALEQGGYDTAIKKAQAQYAPEMAKINLDTKKGQLEAMPILNQLRQAQAARAMQLVNDPFGGHVPGGAVGEAYWMDRLKKQYGEDSPVVQQAAQQLDMANQLKQSNIKRREQLSNAQAFQSLPVAEKQRALSTAIGMGFDPTEAATRLNSGDTLVNMASDKKVDLKDVEPVYPLAGENIKQMQTRGAFSDEIKSLEKNINEATQGFGRRFMGYSPKQVIDAIKNEDPDTQGLYLAARALAPELSSIRLNAMGGRVGIEAIKHLTELSGQNSKIFEPLVSNEARQAMNRYMSDWIDQAQNAYSTHLKKYSSLGRGPQLQSKKSSSNLNDPLGLR